MDRIIVVDKEYFDAADIYKEAACKVHDAAESFKKTIARMLDHKAIAGQTAHNMSVFIQEMALALKATFKEQFLLEALLCRNYVQKMDIADRLMLFSPTSKSVQNTSYFMPGEKQPPPGLIIMDKAAVMQCVEQLKNGPLQDIQSYTSRIEQISFAESMGRVKERNESILYGTLISLRTLTEVFNKFIAAIEFVVTTMQDTDSSIAEYISKSQSASGYKI